MSFLEDVKKIEEEICAKKQLSPVELIDLDVKLTEIEIVGASDYFLKLRDKLQNIEIADDAPGSEEIPQEDKDREKTNNRRNR